MTDDLYKGFRSNPDSLGDTLTNWTASVGVNDLPAGAKAVFFDAAGTCSVAPRGGGGGTPETGIPFTAGVPLPFVPGQVTAMATATKCWVVT